MSGQPLARPGREVNGAGEDAVAPDWLALDLGGRVVADRWIRLVYRTDFTSDPVRPLLRFDGPVPRPPAIIAAPVAGAAIWVGPVPSGTTGLSLQAAMAGGDPVRVDLVSLEVLSAARLVGGAALRSPLGALDALRARLLGRRVRARRLLSLCWNATRPGRYGRWVAERAGVPRRPVRASDDGVPFTVLVEAGGAGQGAVDATLASLAGQPCRTVVLGRPISEADLSAADGHGGWIAFLTAGDRVDPDAVAVLAAAARRHPEAAILTSDEDRMAPDGCRSHPILSPAWSPRLHAARPVWPGLVALRAGVAARAGAGGSRAGLLERALAAGAAVRHVRRVLVHTSGPPGPAPTSLRVPAAPTTGPTVTVVIPNRDRVALLRTCIAGLTTGTSYGPIEIVVVDNGSAEADTLAFYEGLADDPRITVLSRPGPFNFSALTNAGAAAGRGDLLLLLNNDIEVIRPDWLSLMVAEATRPGTGAVGAKLLYPGGRVQHDGVVIGLGGEAGHAYRGRWASRPDLMGRGDVPHEVSAVTGACLLLARRAFEEVGGLDEDLFPVSFNDIDLCLKLRAAGFVNVQVPAAILKHHESASRGRDVGAKQERAEREARAFAAKWLPLMRDDPYFHPALSLLPFDLALG